MIALTAILAWLPMPLDAITSEHSVDWYQPIIWEDVLDKSIEELEQDLKRRGVRILQAGPEECDR